MEILSKLDKVEIRGAAKELQNNRDNEVLISGPAETGKTFSSLVLLHRRCIEYPNVQAAIVRKTRASMDSTVLNTYKTILDMFDFNIHIYGGSRPQWYQYPNGSRVYIGGMDNASKILSGERDFVYVNQTEELTQDDWETLLTRVTGRANNAPYSQLFGDCNPGPPLHWIQQRKTLTLLESKHEDNPTLHTGVDWTERGKKTLSILDTLTGTKKERLRWGRWVASEGLVYEFDRSKHLIDMFNIPADWDKYRAIDFGYINPFVCLWIAVSPDDKVYIYRELYQSGCTINENAQTINDYSKESYVATISDHGAGDREVLKRSGIHTLPAKKDIALGIQAVQGLLQSDKLYYLRGSLIQKDQTLSERKVPTSILEEFNVYRWPITQEGRSIKEQPVKENDHGLDALRYFCMYLSKGRGTGQGWLNSLQGQ